MFFVAFYQSLYLMVELLFRCTVPLCSGLLSTSYCIPSLVWNVWMFLFRWYFCQGIASCIFYRIGKIWVICVHTSWTSYVSKYWSNANLMLVLKGTFLLWSGCINVRWEWHDPNQRRYRFYFLVSKLNSSNALGIQCDLAMQTFQVSQEAQNRWWSNTWKCIVFWVVSWNMYLKE